MLLGYPAAHVDSRQHGDRVEPVRGLDQLLRRLRPGRLARELEVHLELRPPYRARRRTARREQRLHGGVRPHAEPRRRARQRRQPADGPADRRRPGLRRPERRQRIPGQPPGHQDLAARGHGLLDEPEDRRPRRLRHLLGAVELPGGRRAELRQHRLHGGDAVAAAAVHPDRVADQPVPDRRQHAVWQHARRADRCGQRRRVHRPGQDRAADSPVLDRHRPRVARQHRGRLRVRRRHRPRPEPRRLERRRDQHQPGAAAAPVTGRGAARTGAQPVLRPAGRPGQERDAARRFSAANCSVRSRSSTTS